MLSYRHAFHAGNHADVLKHHVLLECLRLMTQKEKGLFLIDTHAGAGSYTLTEGYAAQNEEWGKGIQRLFDLAAPADTTKGTDLTLEKGPEAIQSYLNFVKNFKATQDADGKNTYPGSPAIIAGVLRPQDRAVFCELHPTDAAILTSKYPSDRRIQVRQENGFAALRGLLPPQTRRGLVFIDPPYELRDDYDLVAKALADGLRRFETGVFIVWYPMLERPEVTFLGTELREVSAARPWIDAHLRVQSAKVGERGMTGSGMFIVNPPWPLASILRETLPWLAPVLGQDGGASWGLEVHE